MGSELLQITAAIYLTATLSAGLAYALHVQGLARLSVVLLFLGALIHAGAFWSVHTQDPTPSLTTLPSALSIVAWMSVLFYLAFQRRARLAGLAAAVGAVAFVTVFWSSLVTPTAYEQGPGVFWSHAHILLTSAGLALFGLAALAGVLFLAEHHRLKAKRPLLRRPFLPSLEALDRVNVVALALGFPLLSLGVVTGALWVNATTGSLWPGSPHASWTMVAWIVYAGLAAARFAAHQGARASAVSAVGGFGFLIFAVVGVGAVT